MTGNSDTPAGDNPLPGPIEESYWVIAGRLLAGEYPGHMDRTEAARKVARLTAAGISTFVDLTEDNELIPYSDHLPDGIEHFRLPIRDMSVPSASEMRRIVSTIHDAMERGQTVYVHCWGGIGRTGTVVGCLLAERCGSGEEALEQLRRLWKSVPKSAWNPESPQTSEQRRFVLRWPSE